MKISQLVLLASIILIGFRVWSNRQYLLLQTIDFDTQQLEGYLAFDHTCNNAPPSVTSTKLVTLSAPTYASIVAQLAPDNLANFQTELMAIATQTNNELAQLLALEATIKEKNDPAAWIAATAPLSDASRLHVAEFFLSKAGQCVVAKDIPTARHFMDIGLGILPVGVEDDLHPTLSRRVADIYYFAEDWDPAQQWYERAMGTGGTPYVRIATILTNRGQYGESLSYFRQALQYYPDRLDLHIAAAEAALKAQQDDQVAEFLTDNVPTAQAIDKLFAAFADCRSAADLTCAITKLELILRLDPTNQFAIDELQKLPENQ